MAGIEMATFGQVLRRLRKQAGLSQHALARSAGIPVRVIQKLEQGKQKQPVYDNAVKLARGLGVSVEVFAGEWK